MAGDGDIVGRLLPCPFCGGEAELCSNQHGFGGHPMYWVLCKKCHAGPGERRNKIMAARAWNTRTERDEAVAREREACAMFAMEYQHHHGPAITADRLRRDIAGAIRARRTTGENE